MALGKPALIAVALLVASSPLLAASRAELEDRVDQLERRLNSQGLIDMQDQLDHMRRDVQQMRGDMEVLGHQIDQLEKKQRDLYMDLDQRLGTLEGRPASGGAPAAGVQPAGPGGPVDNATGEAASAPPAPAESSQVAQTYDDALNLLKQKRYTEASRAFSEFLRKYPDSSYADNAQYWIGEAHYVTREFNPALTEFQKVVTQYPTSSKVADARLKIGFIDYELRQWAEARTALNGVITDYPGTQAAQLAQERLSRMKQEGH